MIAPLIKIGALRLGAEFETSLTRRRGTILERCQHTDGITVAMQDGSTLILHAGVKVRPVSYVH